MANKTAVTRELYEIPTVIVPFTPCPIRSRGASRREPSCLELESMKANHEDHGAAGGHNQ
jgi:hypothetical protein